MMLHDIQVRQERIHPLMPRWSLKGAIQDQVDKEDLIRWGMSEDEEFYPISELTVDDEPRFAVLHFAASILP